MQSFRVEPWAHKKSVAIETAKLFQKSGDQMFTTSLWSQVPKIVHNWVLGRYLAFMKLEFVLTGQKKFRIWWLLNWVDLIFQKNSFQKCRKRGIKEPKNDPKKLKNSTIENNLRANRSFLLFRGLLRTSLTSLCCHQRAQNAFGPI